uniref:Uncharacterized protein n=1 Tax=Anguilla anguilla TaxID=7936 RepID=A0A0E9VKB1_ANGAN
MSSSSFQPEVLFGVECMKIHKNTWKTVCVAKCQDALHIVLKTYQNANSEL